MFCRHCGKRLPDDSKFCTYCGKSVVIEDEGASAGQAPEPASTEAAPAPATAPVEAVTAPATAPVGTAPATAPETAADAPVDDAPADDRGPAADASEPSDDAPMADGTSPMSPEPDRDGVGPDAPAGESAAPEPGTPHDDGTPAMDDALAGEVAAQAVPDGWEINLASGGGDVFARYTVSLAGEQLFTIDVHTGSVSVTNTDITDPSGVVILGTTSDGMAVTATRGNGDAAYNNMANIANCLDTVRVK